MCGICGLISGAPLSSENLDCVSRMNAAMIHRGPDGSGEFHDQHFAMAMRRLSIIDLTGGWQPLYNEDKSLALIANGEIYNFVELRAKLKGKGHRFNTGSDCETILHLYEDYGSDCVHHLRGMFAFALWDSKRQRLLLARDRMGEKPLYIYEQNELLIFASELKSLLSSGLVPFELDPTSIDLYFHYQYVPEPRSPIKSVRKLPAGHILVVDAKSWQIKEARYWSMEDAPALTGDPGKLIRAELENISEMIIRSDVPVGVALSGGLDSSAITALAARKYPGTIHAFSVGYPGHPPNDERFDAQALADYLAIPFHDVEIDTRDMVSFFPKLIYWRDDPIADISGYGYYEVMRLAREHNVPVILQGQGGDELFWGYPWVKQSVSKSLRRSALCKKGCMALIDYIKPQLPGGKDPDSVLRWLKSLAGLRVEWENFQRDQVSPCNRLAFYDTIPSFQTAHKNVKSIYDPAFMDNLNGSSAYDLFTFPQPWPQLDILLTRLICQTYLIENGITQGDRLSMASSVELRLPLLDYRLVETTIGLRKSMADYKLPPKAWLKAAIKDILPEWVIDRPKKGFQPPVGEWIRAVFDAHGQRLEDGYLVQAGVLKQESARELSQLSSTTAQLSYDALVLELWCQQFIKSIYK